MRRATSELFVAASLALACGPPAPTEDPDAMIVPASDVVDFGSVDTGRRVDKTLSVTHTGSLPVAIYAMHPSSKLFEAIGGRVVEPGGSVDLNVTFLAFLVPADPPPTAEGRRYDAVFLVKWWRNPADSTPYRLTQIQLTALVVPPP